MSDLKTWCSDPKKKKDGLIPSKLDKVVAYAMMLNDLEPLPIKQFLLELKCSKVLF